MKRNSEILIHSFIEDKVSQKFLKESVKKILHVLPACTDRPKQLDGLALILVSPSVIKKLNYYWRKENKITTVLTFSEGDIFLCPQEIKKQALKRKISLKKFYQLLLIHSILHLFGYTHDKKNDREKMENLENKLLAKIQ